MKFEELINGKRNFFINNQDDLNAFYHVSIEDAIWDTIEDSDKIESMLLELGESDDLDTLFRPLNNNNGYEYN